jgi:hypothetical protein
MEGASGMHQPIIIDPNPSPWWSWGVAIYLGIMVTFGVLGALAYGLIPFDSLADEFLVLEEPGEYPENGTPEEQEEWNLSKQNWDAENSLRGLLFEMEEDKPVQLTISLSITLVGLIAVVRLVQKNPLGFKFGYAWLLLSTISQITTTLKYQALMSGLSEPTPSLPGQLDFATIQLVSNITGPLVCNSILLAVMIACAAYSEPQALEESGFHHQQTPIIALSEPPQI